MTEYNISSAAYSDVVLLLGELPASLKPVSIAELHLYLYLANLLALARGMPLADWGYRFAITSDGFPHAEVLDHVIASLRAASVIEVKAGYVSASQPRFRDEFEFLMSLVQSSRRREWLRTTALCVLNLPKGVIRGAINNSPGFFVHFQQGRVASLLDDADRIDLYDEFALIQGVLGEAAEDHLQPAIVWLSAKVMATG
jgi:hypothetical protein